MRVLIVEDMPETRTWLVAMAAEAFPGAEIIEAGDQSEGLRLCEDESGPAVALVDLSLPDGSGLEVIRRLVARHPGTHRIIVTVSGNDADLVTALSAGAQGYLLKDQPREVLVRQLAQAAEGIPAISPSLARRIMDHFRLTGPCDNKEDLLSPREREVLGLIARGFRIADAARALGMAEGTATSHVKSIYRKLDIGSRAEAALHASRMGLI
jgi:DNA-binding NarL/FixJ family response regulator